MNNTQIEEKVLQVPIEDIIPNRFQPRLSFDDASLADLAASIKQHGIIQPLVLRRKNDKYEIIAGERRYKAARMAGLAAVPAIISNLSDAASAEVAIVENVQRKDLTAIEEARSYQTLLEKGYMTQEDLAKKMGLSQSAISNKLRLLSLDESVQQAVIKEQISERHARSLLKIKNHEMQKVLLNKVITERLTVKQLEEEIKKINEASSFNSTGPQGVNNGTPAYLGPFQNNQTLQAFSAINKILNDQIVSPPEPEEIPEEPKKTVVNTKKSFIDEIDDIPVISSTPNIETVVSKAVDIKSLNQNVAMPTQGENNMNNEKVSAEPQPVTFLDATEKVPNKFFNYLESQAANLSLDEPAKTFNLPSSPETITPSDLLNQTENIEMLDDFVIPQNPVGDKVINNDYLDQVIKTVRGLNFDSDKVVIEEMNLPQEYHITIKIKKDKI